MASLVLLVKVSVLILVVAVGWRYYQNSTRLPPVIEGFFLPEYRPVAELFRRYIEEGTERGASLAVYHEGHPLVELWGGYADPESKRAWRNDTLTMTWGCAQGAAALVVALMVDRGVLDYEAKIAQYWPEFSQNGKDNITVGMLMNHQAGLVTLGGQFLTLLDYQHHWQKIEAIMAAAAPDFPPGSEVVYHEITLGMYLDALVRRVDPQHRTLSQCFDEEIAKPFGIDYHIGLPLQLYHRAARQHFTTFLESLALLFTPSYLAHVWRALTTQHSLSRRARQVLSILTSSTEVLNDPRQMEVGLGSLMGFGSAISLAKMYDILANQGVAGNKVLLSKSLVDSFSVPVIATSPEDVENVDHSYSHGFQVSKNVLGNVIFGHSGFGGQQARADPTHRLGMAYVTNFHWGDTSTSPRHFLQLERVFYDCFQKHRAKVHGR